MGNKKLAVAAVAAMAMTAAYVAEAPVLAQSSFTDVSPSNSHYVGITELAKQGIVTGVTASEFKPYADATRGEAALFLAKALKLDTSNVTDPGFKDVPRTSPYYGAIAALYEKKIVGGFTDGSFQPNGTLKRSQFAKMLTLGFQLKLATIAPSTFTDINAMTDKDTKRYILTLLDYDITNGTTATTFSPYATLKRGQVATFLYRSIQAVDSEFKVISIQ